MAMSALAPIGDDGEPVACCDFRIDAMQVDALAARASGRMPFLFSSSTSDRRWAAVASAWNSRLPTLRVDAAVSTYGFSNSPCLNFCSRNAPQPTH